MRKIIGSIGDAFATEIFARSQDNLSSRIFSNMIIGEELLRDQDKARGVKSKPRYMTTTNTGLLARSGYKKGDRRKLRWEVGYQAPYAYDVNYGTPPRKIPFGNLYQWAFSRRKEIKMFFPDLKPPARSKDPKFWKMYYKYSKSVKKGMKGKVMTGKVPGKIYKASGRGQNKIFEKEDQSRATYLYVFTFAYYTWLNIKKNGIEPTFFFSHAVHSTWNDRKLIITKALNDTEGVKVVS